MSASDSWRTPPALFDALDREFGFTLDAAADERNRLCPVWLGPGGVGPDALTVDWFVLGSSVFLNPPYSKPAPWLAHCRNLVSVSVGAGVIAALVPVMPSERWWRDIQEAAVEIRYIPHRLKYVRADGLTQTTARFPSCVVLFRPQPGVIAGHEPRHVTWTFPREG